MSSWSDLAPIFIRGSGYRAPKVWLYPLQKKQTQLVTSEAAFLYRTPKSHARRQVFLLLVPPARSSFAPPTRFQFSRRLATGRRKERACRNARTSHRGKGQRLPPAYGFTSVCRSPFSERSGHSAPYWRGGKVQEREPCP